ncbi:uncharacterized protein LOC107271007 isoform X2 [Cephus cinctus]|uniref:Uncharacterized protein LOC107271007 isoform X2 n=1 Tax=Cephus cinctus TaxID=211228 RepID=A0AAJ7C4X3_CEPCN|nr:uncharacterized protein LOC107271007 isoform X2 [Cephus cinctus]
MAIMQSCCCWRSVRRGSFACAVYTGLYFFLTAIMTGAVLQEERQYLTGNRTEPQSSSFLEPQTISPTTVRFNVTLLTCSCCGVCCSFLLLYGLFKDQRIYLIPWILTVITFSFIDIAHSMYLFFFVTLRFNPITAMLFTLDFFLLCLNVYSLLCVISQYQEYIAGRGRAADDCEYRIPAVRYAVQPTTTATSCLSSRRAVTNNETRATATATPTQSPTAVQTTLASEKSPTVGKASRKHVQFPDTPSAESQGEKSEIAIVDTTTRWTPETELGRAPCQLMPPAVDTATLLLISSTSNRSSTAETNGGNPQT